MNEPLEQFEVVQPKQKRVLTDEELEKRRAATRDRVAKHREKKRKESNPTAKLAAGWQSALDSLSEEERNGLFERAARIKQLNQRMDADDFSAYRELKAFIEESGGLTRNWVPVMMADEVDLQKYSAGDPVFVKYGLRSKLWLLHYREYLRRLLVNGGLFMYGMKFRDLPKENIGDAETLQEIRAEYDQMVAHLKERPTLQPFGIPAIRCRTEAEEKSFLAWKEDREHSQRLFEADYRRYLESRPDDGNGV